MKTLIKHTEKAHKSIQENIWVALCAWAMVAAVTVVLANAWAAVMG